MASGSNRNYGALALALVMGFSAGLPLLAIGSTLQAWLTDESVDLGTIGLFSLVGLPYTLKFVWAPLLDRYELPFLGRRRGWLFVWQLALVAAFAALAFVDPGRSPTLVAAVALVIGFSSASQDIVVDAYRRETLRDDELTLGSSLYVTGYRLATLVSGALALMLADRIPWSQVYLGIAGAMSVGLLATLLAREPGRPAGAPRTMREAVVSPLMEFLRRDGAIWILLFVLAYKLGDQLAGAMTTPFFRALGFTNTDIATIGKTFGMAATLMGGLVGGGIALKIGIGRALWVFGFLQAGSTLLLAALAYAGHDYALLVAAIGAENFTAGMGTAGYLAFMASQTDQRYTATQYALLSSVMGIPRVILSAPMGYVADAVGWMPYFVMCTLLAIPGLLLLTKVAPWSRPVTAPAPDPAA